MSSTAPETTRAAAALPPTANGRMRFTREQYHGMVEAGLVAQDAPVELLDGEVVFMSPIGRDHLAITDKLNTYFAPRISGPFICRVQGSIALSDVSEPEPDFLVLKHRDDFYRTRDAQPDDAVLLIEVAGSSLSKDVGPKLKLYAKAGIAEYWIVDIAASQLIVHREPDVAAGRYGTVTRHAAPETVAAAALGDHAIDLAWLFA